MATDDLLDTATRRHFVLEQRRKGKTYRDIATAAVDEFGVDRLPKSWDERYAHKDVTRELTRVRAELEETAEDVRALELHRLDQLLAGLWAQASHGKTKAVYAALSVMDRRAKLLGLDAPKKHDLASLEIDMSKLSDDQLKRIADGEDPRTVVREG